MPTCGKGLLCSPRLEQAGLHPQALSQYLGVKALAHSQPVLGSVEGDPRVMWVGLMVLALHLTEPKDCSLPCSELKWEHGPGMGKECSEQGSHGSPRLTLHPLTCGGL